MLLTYVEDLKTLNVKENIDLVKRECKYEPNFEDKHNMENYWVKACRRVV